MNSIKFKDEIIIVKLEADDEIEECPACRILQHYANRGTFISAIECVFCGTIIDENWIFSSTAKLCLILPHCALYSIGYT